MQFDDSIEFQSNVNLQVSIVEFFNSISSSLPQGSHEISKSRLSHEEQTVNDVVLESIY